MSALSEIFEHKKQLIQDISIDRGEFKSLFADSMDCVYPGMMRKKFQDFATFESYFNNHLMQLKTTLEKLQVKTDVIQNIIQSYPDIILTLNLKLEKDAKVLLSGDPAAKNLAEVLLCYPGLYAIAAYRIAHYFYQQKVSVLPRYFSEIAHQKTGIDIHPGAQIGESFFIDHGTGVVIGETAVVGNFVKIYQGVTIGALSVEKQLVEKKRHPTIKDHCVIYSNATILGGNTIIGERSVIGGNVWITKSIPADSIVYHKSEVKMAKLEAGKNIEEKLNQQEELTYDI